MVGILDLSDDCLQADYLASVLFHIFLELGVHIVQSNGSFPLLFVVFYAFFQLPIEFTHADPCALYFSLVLFVGDYQVIDFVLKLSVGHLHNAQPILQLKGLFTLPMELFVEIVSFGFHSADFDIEIVEIVLPLIDLLVVSSRLLLKIIQFFLESNLFFGLLIEDVLKLVPFCVDGPDCLVLLRNLILKLLILHD